MFWRYVSKLELAHFYMSKSGTIWCILSREEPSCRTSALLWYIPSTLSWGSLVNPPCFSHSFGPSGLSTIETQIYANSFKGHWDGMSHRRTISRHRVPSSENNDRRLRSFSGLRIMTHYHAQSGLVSACLLPQLGNQHKSKVGAKIYEYVYK